MTDRDSTIVNKAACYGISAICVVLCALAHLIGSDVAFTAGVFVGVIAVLISELLIYIPPKEQSDV